MTVMRNCDNSAAVRVNFLFKQNMTIHNPILTMKEL